MPFWRRETPEERKTRERQEASILALQNGRLPYHSRKRLELAKRQAGSFFTSDLSTNEYLLAREAGYETLGLVMGTAFFRVGLNVFYFTTPPTGELDLLTQAQLGAREAAVRRLKQEAALLGAHGVVGVRLEVGRRDFAAGLLEFTAVGTAIRVPGRAPTDDPFTSDLSGQEFWALHQAGQWPCGLAFGLCAYYVQSSRETRALEQKGGFLNPAGWINQEVPQFTQCFHRARQLAMRRVAEDARREGAEGVVGMTVRYELDPISRGTNSNEWFDLAIVFVAVGTAIARDTTSEVPAPPAPLLMLDLKDGSTRAVRSPAQTLEGALDAE